LRPNRRRGNDEFEHGRISSHPLGTADAVQSIFEERLEQTESPWAPPAAQGGAAVSSVRKVGPA